MVLINKAKGKGYYVKITGNNNEPLCTSEVLNTKQSCYKNIAATALQLTGKSGVLVKDTTIDETFLVNKAGKKVEI